MESLVYYRKRKVEATFIYSVWTGTHIFTVIITKLSINFAFFIIWHINTAHYIINARGQHANIDDSHENLMIVLLSSHVAAILLSVYQFFYVQLRHCYNSNLHRQVMYRLVCGFVN